MDPKMQKVVLRAKSIFTLVFKGKILFFTLQISILNKMYKKCKFKNILKYRPVLLVRMKCDLKMQDLPFVTNNLQFKMFVGEKKNLL